MKKIGLFYSFHTTNTTRIAKLIASKFGADEIEEVNIETVTDDEFLKFDKYILGTSTWWDGELPNPWDEFRPALEDFDLSGKTFAFFGLGDPKKYTDNFGNAIGILKEIVEEGGAKTVGSAPIDDFTFDGSTAIQDGRFVGVLLDEDNEKEKSEARIDAWLPEVKKAFGKK